MAIVPYLTLGFILVAVVVFIIRLSRTREEPVYFPSEGAYAMLEEKSVLFEQGEPVYWLLFVDDGHHFWHAHTSKEIYDQLEEGRRDWLRLDADEKLLAQFGDVVAPDADTADDWLPSDDELAMGTYGTGTEEGWTRADFEARERLWAGELEPHTIHFDIVTRDFDSYTADDFIRDLHAPLWFGHDARLREWVTDLFGEARAGVLEQLRYPKEYGVSESLRRHGNAFDLTFEITALQPPLESRIAGTIDING